MANKKYKTQILRSNSYTHISIGVLHDRDIFVVGIMLLHKYLGINSLYECEDGYYMQICSFSDKAQLYALEVYHTGSQETEALGPKHIEEERKGSSKIYHVFIDSDFLHQARIDQITQISLISCPTSERVIYGQNGDDFNHRVKIGLCHDFLFPQKVKRLNGKIYD